MESNTKKDNGGKVLNLGMKENLLGPRDFLKKLGKGKTLSKPLSYDEAQLALEQMLEGRFTQSQLGAILQAWRLVELSQDELNAMTAYLMKQLRGVEAPQLKHTVVLNICSDTARKGGILAATAAHILCLWDVDVYIVANMPMLSKNTRSLSLSLECGEKALEYICSLKKLSAPGKLRVGHCDDLIEQWSLLEPVRQELGFRSCLHTLEKLVNPWPKSPFVTALSHKHYALRMAEALNASDVKNASILLGNHGTVDLNLHKGTESYQPGNLENDVYPSPADLGLDISPQLYSLKYMESWPEESTRISSTLWGGIQYELAFLLVRTGLTGSMDEAMFEIRQRLAL